MKNILTAALFFLAAGIFTSVSILSIHQIFFAIAVIYYTYMAIKNKSFALPKSAWALMGFAIVAFVASAVNHDLLEAPGKSYGRIKYYLLAAASIFAFRVYVKEVNDKTIKVLINTFFVSMIVAGGYCVFQKVFGGYTRGAVLTETMRYGYGTGMILSLLLGIILRPKFFTEINRPLLYTACIFGLLGIWATVTRGALLGLMCAIPFSIFFWNRRAGIIGAIAIGIIVSALGGIYLFGSKDYGSRFLSNKNNGSDTIRRSQWQGAYIAWKERPILGWGLSNFSSQLPRIKNQYDLDHKEYNDAHAHNIFLETASGTGIIGLLFFTAFLVLWAIEMWKAGGVLQGLIVPFGVALVVCGQFEVILDANNSSMIFFIYGLSVALKDRLSEDKTF